jgi:hypothetical protein
VNSRVKLMGNWAIFVKRASCRCAASASPSPPGSSAVLFRDFSRLGASPTSAAGALQQLSTQPHREIVDNVARAADDLTAFAFPSTKERLSARKCPA